MKTHGALAYSAGNESESAYWKPTGAHWILKSAPYVTIKVKRMFPRANQSRTGEVFLDDTPEVARDLEWLLFRYPFDLVDDASERLFARAQEHRDTEAEVHSILSGERKHFDFREPARPARDYQLIAADLMLSTGRLLLTDVLGLGKTMSSLLVLRDPKALPALIVCPTHLPQQWVEELEKTLPWLAPHIVRKSTPYDPSKHRSMKGRTPDVLIASYSKLRGWADHLAGEVNTVIFDEAQELRRPESQKYHGAVRIAEKCAIRVGLTATPVYNYAGEIHSIYEVIAPGALGSREEFIREWGGRNTRSTIGDTISVKDPAALGAYLRSEGLMLRRTRKDVGRELPAEPQHIVYAIDTDEDRLERETGEIMELADTIVQRTGTREELFQARGQLDWRLRRATGVAKAAFVADFVEGLIESEEQVVLFGWHRDVYEIWEKKLRRYRPAFYTGTESPTQKMQARDAFLDGEARVLVMSLRSGSGLDGLQQVSNVAVFGELDWSPGIHAQCIGRLDRDGQENAPVLAYFLVSNAGSDPVVADVLNLKRMQSEPLINPDAPLLQPMADQDDRVMKLAQYVVSKRREQGQRAAPG